MAKLRVFIALPTSQETKALITGLQSQLKDSQADVRWEQPDKFHITLKFLGDCEQEMIPPLQSRLQLPLGEIRLFDVVYQSLGGFPDSHHPRIVWIGTAENPAINDLQSQIEDVCTQFGFKKEDRAFHPHITLGRVKDSRNLQRLTERLKTITFEPIHERCVEVHLMRSEMKPTGSIYTILHSIPLHS